MTNGTISKYPATMYLRLPERMPPPASVPNRKLPVGQEIEIRTWQMVSGLLWMSATLPDGTTGYIAGVATIDPHHEAELDQESGVARAEPSQDSTAVGEYLRGDRFTALQTLEVGWKIWRRIRDQNGVEGYLHARIQPTGPLPQWASEQDAARQRLNERIERSVEAARPKHPWAGEVLTVVWIMAAVCVAVGLWALGSNLERHHSAGPLWVAGLTLSTVGKIVTLLGLPLFSRSLWRWMRRRD